MDINQIITHPRIFNQILFGLYELIGIIYKFDLVWVRDHLKIVTRWIFVYTWKKKIKINH